MKLNISFTSNINKKFDFTYVCDDDILVEDFLKKIKDKYFPEFDIDDSSHALLGHFNFVNNNVRQKARLEFKLLSFLNNFNYKLDSINMEFLYGIGGGFNFDNIAIIRVNANEPHMAPHVHIYSGKQSEDYVRIVLSSMSQMKNDSIKFEKLFTNKERKKIKDFLEKNKDKIVDYYKRSIRGEYITQEYILTYNGKEYILYKNNSIN